MAPILREVGIVYHQGKRRNKDYTPRPSDAEPPENPQRLPGLSTSEKPKANRLNQHLDLSRLRELLRAFADAQNHVAIVPVNEAGEVDYPRLREWAATRDSDEPHPFTQILLDANVGRS